MMDEQVGVREVRGTFKCFKPDLTRYPLHTIEIGTAIEQYRLVSVGMDVVFDTVKELRVGLFCSICNGPVSGSISHER